MRTIISTIVIILILSACKSTQTDPQPVQNHTPVLNATAQVILSTYEDLSNKAAKLQESVALLKQVPVEAHLALARQAWRDARQPWECSEGFLFGPVDQEGLDPSMDSWPVNVNDLKAVLNSSHDLTVEFLQQQEGTLKGFHTIEYLLWGEDGKKNITDFTSREFEYLEACAGALAQDAARLYELWRLEGGNYIANVINAGNGSKVYVSQKAALEEIVNALAVITDEVANGKINEPFSQKDLTLEESRFSANSKNDFANNMRSIQNIYLAQYNGKSDSDNSLSSLVKSLNPSLDTRLKEHIQKAIDDIEAIPGTFSEAVFSHRTEVQKAQQSVRDLQDLIEGEVLPLISSIK